MNALLAAVAGMLLATGIALAIAAFLPAPAKPEVQKRPKRSGAKLSTRFNRRTKTLIIVGVIAGVLAAIISGVIILAIVVPIAIVGLPLLLGKPDTRERDILAALESWSRALASASATGRLTLREVITITRTSTPEVLREPVDLMVYRISTTWTVSAALRAFADEMDSAKVDEVAVYLIQAAEADTRGLAAALNSIADTLANEVKLTAEVFKEREKPRRVMVQIMIISGVVLGLVVLFARSPQLAPYATPIGQVLLVIVLSSLVALLFWARAIGRVQSEPRFLLTRDEPAQTTQEVAR